MQKKHVLLLDVGKQSKTVGTYTKHSVLEPYGLECIGAAIQNLGFDVKILQKRTPSTKHILSYEGRATLFCVGFSVRACNLQLSLKMAKEIKNLSPDTYVVFGGDYPSACPEIVKDDSVDFIVIGEGERTFGELLKFLDSGGEVTQVDGIAYWNGKLVITRPRKRIVNLDQIPFALRNEAMLKDCRIYALMYPPPSKQRNVAQTLYSRGCPHHCSFCSSSKVWGHRVEYRSPYSVVSEIKELQNRFATNTIFFADLTFNLDEAKVFALCDEMLKQRVKINWMAMCNLRGDGNLFKKMKQAGCTKIGFGIETLSCLARRRLNKREAIHEIKRTLDASDSVGIINRGYIMIGYPWDTREGIHKTFNILKTLPLDELKVSFFTPFPGTQAYQEFKPLLLTDDLGKYTTNKPVLKINDLSSTELIDLRKNIVRNFYLSNQYKVRMYNKIEKFPYLRDSYEELFDFLRRRNVLEGKD